MINKVIYVDFKNRTKKLNGSETPKRGIITMILLKIKNAFKFSHSHKTDSNVYNFKKTM